jgi:hypothetical protein
MEKKERKELLNLKLLTQKEDDDGIFESLFQSLFLAIIFGLFVMFLWNALLPEIFKFPEINYLQSVGLIVLARLIFGGIAFRHNSRVSRRSQNRNKKLMGLSKIDDISDWKYYDSYWEEVGKQNFEEYKMKKKEINDDDK